MFARANVSNVFSVFGVFLQEFSVNPVVRSSAARVSTCIYKAGVVEGVSISREGPESDRWGGARWEKGEARREKLGGRSSEGEARREEGRRKKEGGQTKNNKIRATRCLQGSGTRRKEEGGRRKEHAHEVRPEVRREVRPKVRPQVRPQARPTLNQRERHADGCMRAGLEA